MDRDQVKVEDSILLSQQPTIRRPNDTCPWRK